MELCAHRFETSLHDLNQEPELDEFEPEPLEDPEPLEEPEVLLGVGRGAGGRGAEV